MRLTDFFTGNNQIANSNQASQSQAAQGQSAAASARQTEVTGSAQMRGLTPGQVVRGELVSSENGEVQIKLLNDLLIGAKLDGDFALELGKLMNFQVRSNGRSLMLTPLQANLSMEGPVSKALEMADIPVNSATAEMTKQMMQAGLSINRESLQQMYRELIHQSAGQISDLIDLHKLGLPVTEENLVQMESYKNLTHQLSSGLADATQALLDALGQMQEGDSQGAAALYLELTALLGEEGAAGTGEAIEAGQNAPKDSGQSGTQDILTNLTNAEPALEAGTDDRALSAKQLRDSLLENLKNLVRTADTDPESGGTALSIRDRYADALSKILQGGQFSPQEEMDLVRTLVRQGLETNDRDLTDALMSLPKVKQLLVDQFQKQWTIAPEQVADPKEVENLYGRLTRQFKGIMQALDSAGQNHTQAFQSVSNLNQNLDFLNQINHMYSYVQLPLRFQEGRAQGDLYVYANKKNLASKDGPITALLHLDMQNLGPLDVYVSMQMEKVSTKFTVRDDEMLDFLEAHMDLLTSRLEKRGYSMTVQTSVKDSGKPEETAGIGPILAQATPGLLIQARGFDVRT